MSASNADPNVGASRLAWPFIPARSFSPHPITIIRFHRRTFHFMAFDGTSTRNASSIDGGGDATGQKGGSEIKKKKRIAGNWELNPDVNLSCSRGQARSDH